MLISALSLAVGQLLWSFADLSDAGTKVGSFSGIVSLVLAIAPGFIVYAVGALVMTIALGSGELSVLQPINSMSYVFALILSMIFQPEVKITVFMVVGIFVIMAGVVMIGGGSKNE